MASEAVARCGHRSCGSGRAAFAVGTFLGFAVDVFSASDAIVALGVSAFVHSNGIAPRASGIATTQTARFTSQLKATALFGSCNACVVDLRVAARACSTVAIRVTGSATSALAFRTAALSSSARVRHTIAGRRASTSVRLLWYNTFARSALL